MAVQPQTTFFHRNLSYTSIAFKIYNDKTETRPWLKFVDWMEDLTSDGLSLEAEEYLNFHLMLGFGTSSITFNESNKQVVIDALRSSLGPAVSIIGSYSSGLVGNKLDANGVRHALELENANFTCMSGLLLPRMERVNFQKFEIATQDYKTLQGKTFKNLIGIGNEHLLDLKGILLLLDANQDRDPILKLLTLFLGENKNVVVAGGSVGSLISSESHDLFAIGLLVFGSDEDVKVGCNFMEAHTEADLEKEINEFQPGDTSVISGTRGSFAVKLSSKERRQEKFGKPGVESGCFQRAFPRTKLVGTVAEGQFGREKNGPIVIKNERASLFFLVSYAN